MIPYSILEFSYTFTSALNAETKLKKYRREVVETALFLLMWVSPKCSVHATK